MNKTYCYNCYNLIEVVEDCQLTSEPNIILSYWVVRNSV
ncbi:MAG: hypothetical protein IFNCLDLE_01746 [Ignavibacteriaceae bacterium]|nr:hypothetical protein [Ignavibacteriaceae bacterium]